MTVAALKSTIDHVENGVTKTFAAPFRFKSPAHLRVTRVVAGVLSVMAPGADYTVSGGATDAGGSVTMTTAAAAGTLLRIERRTPRSQSMAYTTGDRFPAASHEQALDNLMLIAQEGDDRTAAVAREASEALNPINQRLTAFGNQLAAVAASGGGPVDPATLNNLVLNQPGTAQWYAEHGSKIQRTRDRRFGGAAGTNLGTNAGAQPDWLTQFLLSKGRTFGFQQVAQEAVLTQLHGAACNGFLAGGQTAPFTGAGNAIGVIGVAVNNNVDHFTGAYGAYFEGYQGAGAQGPAYGVEIDTHSNNPTATIDPYQQAATQVVALQLASGAEYAPAGQFAASAAINIRNNGATYQRGVIFGHDALTGCDGIVGTAIAVALAKGHGFAWYNAAGVATSSIYGETATVAKLVKMRFDDAGVDWSNFTGRRIFQIENADAATVNHIMVSPSLPGQPVRLSTAGEDGSVDLRLSLKGTGAVWLGPWTSGAGVIDGYIAVKDQGGTVRRLATVAA